MLLFFSGPTEFQAKNINILREIDALKASAKNSGVDLLRRMAVNFTQQSCAIENNTLGVEETQVIWNSLKENHNLDNLCKNQELSLPAPRSLSEKPKDEVIEIRNHLLATYLLHSDLFKLKQELDLDDIKKIHRIILKDTSKETVVLKNGSIQNAGEFREVKVCAAGFH